jgi:hypothetical protein
MATDVIIDPSTGQIYWNDSAGVGTESISIKGDAVNTISFTGYSASFSPGSTPAGALTLVTIKDSAGTDALIPGTSGYNLGSSTLRWNTFATNANLSGTLLVSDSTISSSLLTGSTRINGGIAISGNASIGQSLNFYNTAATFYTGFRAGTISANTLYTLPTAFPGAGTSVLQSDTSGVMSWVPMSATSASSGGTVSSGTQYQLAGYYSGTGASVSGSPTFLNNTAIGQVQIAHTTASFGTTSGALQVAGGVGISGRLSFNQAAFGTTGISTVPTMAMIGQTGDPIYMSILEDNSISFEGSQGQLFSISPNLTTGYIWSVNDISGVPFLRSSVGGTIGIAEFGGVVGIGQTNPIYKLDLKGNFGLASSNDALYNFIFSNSAASGSNSFQIRSANSILLYNTGNTFYTGFKSRASADKLYLLPATDGSSGQFLQTDGAQNLTWATASGGSGSGSSGVNPGGQYEVAIYAATGASVSGSSTLKNDTAAAVVSISHSTLSTNYTNGALTVSGGVGIGGSLYVGGIGASITGVTFSNSSITRGSWNGTVIAPQYGGTGLNNISATGLLQYSSGTASVITTSSALASIISDETGSGALVFATSPTLTTPTLGVATATSINKVAFTAPATAATLTLAEGSTLVTSGANSLTLTTTAASNVTLPTAGTLITTGNKLSIHAATTSAELLGVISDETGSGLLVFATSPDFTTSVTTGSGTFTLFNTNATTINAFGAATVMSIGAATGKATFNSTDNSISTTTGGLVISGGAGIAKSLSVGGYLQLFSGSNYTAFVSSASGNTVYTLPATSPATGSSVLQSTSTGVMSWVPMVASSSGTGAGSGTVAIPDAQFRLAYYAGTGASVSSTNLITAVGTGVTILGATNASSTTVAALSILGGLGVTGNAFIGGTINVLSTSVSNISNVSFTNGIITSGTWSGSTITAFYGGTGLQGPTAIGDIIVANSATTWSRYATSATSGQVLTSNGTGNAPTWQAVPPSAASSVAVTPTTVAASFFVTAVNTSNSSGLGLSTITSFVVNPNSGIVSLSGLAVTSTTGSGSTTTGALTVVGGAGIGGTLNVGGTISSIGASIVGPLYTNTIIIGQTGNNINFNDPAGNVLGNFNTSNGWFRSAQTTESNNKDSGALVSLGGLGVAKNAFIGGTASVTSTQVSISTSSGALVVTGGVGIGGSLYTSIGSSSSVSGVILANGNVSATTYNKLTLTAPASSATLTLANGSSLITSGGHSLTFTTSNTTSLTLPTTGTLATTSNKLSDFAATTSLELKNTISDETGSGALVFATSPDFTTSVTTGSGTFALFNATATTINAFGAATVMSIGAATGKATFNSTDNSISSTTGGLVVSGGAGIAKSLSVAGRLQMFNGANYTAFVSAASGDVVYTLPPTVPSGVGSSYLSASTTGVMAWVSAPTSGGSATPGGNNKQIQYNSSNTFAGASGFEYTTGGTAVTVSIFSPSGTGYTSGLWISAIGGTVTRVGIGLSNPQFELEILGEISATNKSFVIDHPTKQGMKLRYGSLEGPENGVYVRGELKGNNIIEVPDHWIGLVHKDSYTVHLTPIGRFSQLYVEKIENYNVFVADTMMCPIHCYYSVWAERKDIPKLVTEYEAQ